MNNAQIPPAVFLTLEGVPVEDTPPQEKLYFWFDPQGMWRTSAEDLTYEIDADCVRLHDALAAKIFDGLSNYHKILPSVPQWVQMAGMNSEAPVSKDFFEQLIAKTGNLATNKLLYLYDCRKLVSGIQEASIEVAQLQGEFFKTLNLEELFYPSGASPDGVRHISSPVTARLHALINVIFIRLHSLLDYTTKIAYETEHFRSDFSNYPRLSSRGKLYGDRRRISLNNKAGTLFEPCELIKSIETIRNQIIHDGFLDDQPKVYEVREGGIIQERFILMPDMVSGRLAAFGNRNLFYGGEDKINLRLPSIVEEFQKRLLASVKGVLGNV